MLQNLENIVLIATDDDALIYSIVNVPSSDSLELSESTVKYTPNLDFSDSDLFNIINQKT